LTAAAFRTNVASGFIKIAHRGASGTCPENTRPAFEKAIAARVDMIEMDCRLSKDGHVVIFHDERLNRVARTRGTVKGKTLAQLKRLDVGRWFKKAYAGERILTLEEAIRLVAGRADVNLDIKRGAGLGIELKVLFILSFFRYLSRALLSSSDYRILATLRELAPRARLALVCEKGMREDPVEIARRLRAESLQLQKECATPELMGRARAAGLKTLVWTVNRLSEMERYLARGADGLISDFPERLWKVRPPRRAARL
jgi:glycerophosphoryl diester phosphodiesterase